MFANAVFFCYSKRVKPRSYPRMKRSAFLLPLLALSLTAYAQDEAPADDAAATAAETTTADTATADAPAADAAAKEEDEPIADGNVTKRAGEERASDATLRLREQIKQLDKELANIETPSRSLQSACKSAKMRAERALPGIDKQALDIRDMQEKFNRAGSGDYEFTIVSMDDRMKYVRDGEAAYKAMLVDMKEKKSKRKIGGLDKFEIMRDRYQGIPEYTQAHEWYIKTMKSLDKKWKKMAETEKGKRKGPRAATMDESDKAEFDKLAEKFRENDEDIAAVWYNPSPRNLYMLKNCLNKVEDVMRRNERTPLDKEVGTVPTLLSQEWALLDNVRSSMLNGQLEEADRLLKDDDTILVLKRLKTNLFPADYREPLMEQRGDIAKEVQKRMRDYKMLKQQLERQTRTMDQAVASTEAVLNDALKRIEAESDQDSGSKTAEIVEEQETTDGADNAPAAENNAAE